MIPLNPFVVATIQFAANYLAVKGDPVAHRLMWLKFSA